MIGTTWGYICNYYSFAVASEGVSKDECKLATPVWDELTIVFGNCEEVNNIS